MTEKEKKLKSLIRFHSANKIDNYNTGSGGRGGKEKNPKNLQNTSKHQNNVFLESPLSESLSGSHSPPHLHRMPCNTVLISACCGGSSGSNLVLLLCVLASNVHSYLSQCAFFYGSSQWPFICSIDRVCLVDRVDLICSVYSWWEGFGSSSLATLPLGFNCGFISTSTCGSSTGV